MSQTLILIFKKWRTVPKVALLKLCANVRNNFQHCCLKNVRSLFDSVGSGVQMDATTLNNVGTCSGLHHNIDKLKEFERLYCDTCEWPSRRPCVNARVWPQQCWKSYANRSNIIALHFGDHGAKEMLGVAGSKIWPLSTTCNRLCNWMQHITSDNVGPICMGL